MIKVFHRRKILPMNNALLVQINESWSQLCNPKLDYVLTEASSAFQMDSLRYTILEHANRTRLRLTHIGGLHPAWGRAQKNSFRHPGMHIASWQWKGGRSIKKIVWDLNMQATKVSRASSSSLRSCMMFATAFCLIHRALSMYLRA